VDPEDVEVRDLGSRSDVHDLVVGFYREVVFDDLLEPVFGVVAEVDWASHIPKLIDYWCRVLFGDPSYRGTVLAPHRHVHEIEPLRVEHFDRWYHLWVTTIDDGWAGPIAEQAKRHAARIGGSLARRLLGIDWRPTDSAGVEEVAI
jgi:hemoglobin